MFSRQEIVKLSKGYKEGEVLVTVNAFTVPSDCEIVVEVLGKSYLNAVLVVLGTGKQVIVSIEKELPCTLAQLVL